MELPNEFDVSVRSIAVAMAPEGIGETIFEDAPAAAALEIVGAEFRRTLGMFATGVTVITTKRGDQVHGMTANAFMSVSLQPPLILISIDRRAKMNALLHEGVRYGVSVLEESQSAVSDRFAGRAADGAVEPVFEIVHDTPLVQTRSPISSRGSSAPTGAETIRFSSARSSTCATATARRCSSTAAATSASSPICTCSRTCRRSCCDRSSPPGSSGTTATAT